MDAFPINAATHAASCAPMAENVLPSAACAATPDEPEQAASATRSVAAEYKERARKREIASYLSATSIPPNLDVSITPLREVCKDANITALVQLGAFRLDTDRAFLSLIDGAFQYIVSESTRTNSLAKADETMFLGVSKLPLSFGVCPRTIDYFNDDTGRLLIKTPNIVADRSRYIINDFRADAHYATRPYVTGFPYMVSYAEVPLISPLGYVLGSYCVVDNKLRDFDNDESIKVLSEMAAAIMTHLDLMRLKQSRARAEQLLTGLGQFMEHDSQVPRHGRQSSLSESRSSASGTFKSLPSVVHDAAVQLPQDIITSESDLSNEHQKRPTLRTYPSTSDYSIRTEPHSGSSGDSGFTSSGKRSEDTPPTSPSRSIESNPFDNVAPKDSNNSDGAVTLEEEKPTSVPGPVEPEAQNNDSLVSADVQSTFARAAALIRDTMSMDGLVFLDACPTGFNTRSNHPTPHEMHDPFESDAADEPNAQEQTATERYSEIIAGSLSPQESQAGVSFLDPSKGLPEAVVQRFVRRFPRGNIFTADEFGPIDCDFGPGTSCRSHKPHRRQTTSRLSHDVEVLFRFFPGARYVVFLPLWHFQRETWFGATFGYVKSPTQAIDIDELNLLTAFGNSIMAEVSRYEALAVSRAKGDFINSISHELRSPLHGIMASGELLREAVTDPKLFSMLDMIDSCGTTLLDTVNSILDYSKINNVAKSLEAGDHDGLTFQKGQSPAGTLTDLSTLVTEVVEGVHLGFTKTAYQMVSEQESMFALSFGLDQGSETLPDDTVLVTLHIQKRPSWITKLDKGAWRRIVMNIFGNALKYTRSGYIEVNLKLIQVQDLKGRARSHISFSCRDTGIGMSREYKKYQLFQPWSQENTLSPGTGLGLSIVNQLVKSLHGTLNVESQIGVGTTVTVVTPLLPDSPGPLLLQLPSISEASIPDSNHALRGLSLNYVTPALYRATVNHDFKITGDVKERSNAIQRALASIGGDVLGMKVFVAKENDTTAADFTFFDAHLLGHSVSHDLSDSKYQALVGSSPSIFLCNGQTPPLLLKRLQTIGSTFIVRHPLGPRKLATILLEALQSTRERVNSSIPIVPVDPHALPLEPNLVDTYASGNGTSPMIHPQASSIHETKTINSPFSGQPTTITPAPSPSPPQLPNSSNSPSSQHLLLVDDNPINLRILATLVSKMPNTTYVSATNGLEAVQIHQASSKPFSIIFMDISMPVMDGFTAIREIRTWEKETKLKPAKIVALTGLGSASSKQEAFASGTNIFLTKPVKLAEVRRLMVGMEREKQVEKDVGHPELAPPV